MKKIFISDVSIEAAMVPLSSCTKLRGKKFWFIFLFCLSVSGCAVKTTSVPAQLSKKVETVGHEFPSNAIIEKLLPGISRQEAHTLIGRAVTTGYELKEGTHDQYLPVTTANPYRSQKITRKNEVFEIDYYLTHIRNADGEITEDELTPLVFQDNQLIGSGWDFFKTKIKQ